MRATDALAAARLAGITIRVDGERLVASAETKPSNSLLSALRENKAGIVAILRAAMRPENVGDDEWLAAVEDAARLGYWVHPSNNEGATQ